MRSSSRCLALATAALAAALVATVVVPTVAQAAPGDTTTTFTVDTGGLSISVPATRDLGNGAPGTTVTSALGAVTVTDTRALLTAAWTATASAVDFTTGGATTAETVPVGDATYTPGTVTTVGTATDSPSTQTLTTGPQTVMDMTAGSGNNSASWSPTIAVALPANTVGGAYTGAVTHSVA